MNYTGHLAKYNNNKKLIKTLEGYNSAFNDWIVTSAFYSALHLVDGTILESSENQLKPKDHKTREKYLTKIGKLKNIRNEYQALYFLSCKSRYECVKIKDREKRESLEYLKIIEGELLEN